MPHVAIKLFPGKTEEQKIELSEAIRQSMLSIFKSTDESISIAFEEIDKPDWLEKVYKPEIEAKQDQLYKKPGYDAYNR
jgi:4-oxalocrotonate tautomerase